MLKTEPLPGGTIKPFRVYFRVLPAFMVIVTVFGLRRNQGRQGAGCNRPKRMAGTGHRLSEADVVKLRQSRANWLSCRVLHRCSVDLVVRKVRLSPGSDRIADHSADPGCARSGPFAADEASWLRPYLIKRLQQRFRLFENRCTEALAEPAIDRRKHFVRLGARSGIDLDG